MQSYFQNVLFLSSLFPTIVRISTGLFAFPPLEPADENCPVVTEVDIYDYFQRNGTPSLWVRPVKDFNKPVEINIEFYVRNLVGLDEKNQELFIRGAMFLSWVDEFRAWNTTFPLNCMDTVSLPFGKDTNIWTPSIFFSNS